MKILKSYGVIIVFLSNPRQYLIVQSGRHGHWGFAKGGIEKGESERETALRELEEETGLVLEKLIPSFDISDSYTVQSSGSRKDVKFFIGISDTQETKIDNEEISNISWLPYEKARERLTYESSRQILEKVEKYLNENISNRNIL